SQSPARSILAREVANAAHFGTAIACWPMEDAGGTQFASIVSGGSPLRFSGETPDFAATGPVLGSNSVAVLGETTRLSGDIPTGPDAFFDFTCLLDVPALPGWADGTPLVRLQMD